MYPSSTTPKIRLFLIMLLLTLLIQLQGLPSSALCEETVPIKKPQIETVPDIPIEDESHASPGGETPNWLKRNTWWVTFGGIVLGGAAVLLGTAVSVKANEKGGSEDGSYKLNW
jgi:hypothetical protein